MEQGLLRGLYICFHIIDSLDGSIADRYFAWYNAHQAAEEMNKKESLFGEGA